MYFMTLPLGEYCNKCGITEEEQLIMDYWYQVNNFVMTDIDKAWKKEIFGYGSECYFNSINNFHYLLSLLLHIHRQQVLDPTKDIEYFNDLYDLECIKKTFRCHGFNINKALAVFGMAENIPYPHSPDVPLGFYSTSSSDCVCSNSTFTYTPIPIIPEAIVTWSRDAVAGISNPSATGTGGISETLINTTTETVTTYYIITITNGTAIYTETIDVCVKPIPTVTSSLGPIRIGIGGNKVTVTYTPTSDIIGATFEWNRPTTECITEPGTSGTGNISEYLTVYPWGCNIIYNVRACYNGCCGEWVEVVFYARAV